MPSYPGLGLGLCHMSRDNGDHDDSYPVAMEAPATGTESEMLLVREVAMMIIMDRLTDKPNWHLKVFDEAITKKWTQEALSIPAEDLWNQIVKGKPDAQENRLGWYPKKCALILDEACLQYCYQELRHKAAFFSKTGVIPTLDASASVVKSDSLVDASLHDALKLGFQKLKADQHGNPDWHPWTDNTVQDLVHPSLHPLIYGRTRVFADEVVGVDDAIDKWAGRGDRSQRNHENTGHTRWKPDRHFWSDNYQWLPSNIKFRDDGTVKFTSYINNLHPLKHRDTYRALESLIEKALPAWNTCLVRILDREKFPAARNVHRFPRPEDPNESNEENWTPTYDEFMASRRGSENEADATEEDDDDNISITSENGERYSGSRSEVEWQSTREPVFPAPPPFEAFEYGCKPENSLQERFSGLQVIVKMASIELTPEKPSFPVGGWHVEGQMNEHIVATALYYLDSENITPSHLEFRLPTDDDDGEMGWNVEQDNQGWMERAYGTRLKSYDGAYCLQNYGNVETRPGRLLAFPNVFHHRVSPFELIDKTKPGHRRFIAIWLVDPNLRIISTANVPPQQRDWWMERSFRHLDKNYAHQIPSAIAQLVLDKVPGHAGLEEATRHGERLPAELMIMIRSNIDDDALPMSKEEADEHRLKLMKERSNTQDSMRAEWVKYEYNFCEH